MSESPQPRTMQVSLGLFGVGLLAVVAIFVLFAAGFEDLPVWLNLAALLAPAGLAVGLVTMLLRSRRSTG